MTVTAPAAVMKVWVLCSQPHPRLKGLCDQKLAQVAVDRLEVDLQSDAELVCPRCHTTYKLSDYLGRVDGLSA